MAAWSLRVVEKIWKPSLADCITFERHNGRWLPYSRTYILYQISNTQNAKHVAFLATGAHFAHWSIWNDLSRAARHSWRMQELFLHGNCITHEICGSEMTHYAKKHLVDHCSACSVAHAVVQSALHGKYLEENVPKNRVTKKSIYGN